MGVGVAGGVQHPQPHSAGLQHLTVAHRDVVKGNAAAFGQYVGGSDALGQLEAAGHVVVVDVGLDHVADLQPARGDQVQDAVEVALGVDHHGDLTVGGEVAPVAETRRLDRLDLDNAVRLLPYPVGY